MLDSLLITNFVLIEDASLQFAPGLTVLTGETGAGKTLLTQALGLLLGERATEDMLGPRGDESLIQAVFNLSEDQRAASPQSLRELLGETDSELVAGRRLGAGGRGRCFLNGMVVPREVLRDALGGLLAFTAQQEHRRLLDSSYQLMLLDAFAGEHLAETLGRYRAVFQEWRSVSRKLAEAKRAYSERSRERESLIYEVEELEQAGLSETEEQELLREQRVLARAEEITLACTHAAELLSGDEPANAVKLVAAARTQLAAVADVDPVLDKQADLLLDAAYELTEAARELRRSAASINVDVGRREEVELRLRLFTDMARKYGGSTATALERLEMSRRRLNGLTDLEAGLAESQARSEELKGLLERLTREVSAARREAAPQLAQAVNGQLADLDMQTADFTVHVTTNNALDTLTYDGGDTVEFMLASNPGLPPRPLAKVASGGELSRTLLALKCAVAGLEGRETLVFDEIDAGIGGRTALAVGEKLRDLARSCQVIVITHLPQVAAYADRHYLISKVTEDQGALTRLVPLDEEAVLAEICRMLGAVADEPGAVAHARALRRRALNRG
ncbi:MAG: DNA repair protein RecN [Actinobacteria bacterium]|nr:DNA repair protein RecN [Actinomycetota bacterium]